MVNFLINPKPWYSIYHEIALELQKIYNIHKENSGRELFFLLDKSSFLRKNETWLKNVKKSYSQSIDPIQLFISFSKSRQLESDRNKILEEVWSTLNGRKHDWLSIDFDGRPSPIGLRIENIRTEQEQNEIWECLDTVLKNGKKGLTPKLWQQAMSWRGIKEAAFTIFLFWIDSHNFIPLDNNTHQYLIYLRYLDLKTRLNFQAYSKLLNYKRIRSYTNLSIEAYNYLHRPKDYRQETPHVSNKDKSVGIISGFKILGLKTLRRNSTNHKVLIPQTFYSFDNYYQAIATDDDITEFKVDFSKFDRLYDIEDKFKLGISAIVGKNGSGKSTLIDLILMGVYNLSLLLGYLEKGKALNGLNFELYWMADKIYKLVFTNKIELFEFKELKNKEKLTTYRLEPNPIDIKKNIDAFFYSILINYSHYALNSREKKIDWVTPLSHKNDGYKTPLVINPKRTEGNINVNREKQLMNIRLLLNLLDLHDPSDAQKSFRCIEDGKSIKYFTIHLDIKKCKEVREKVKEITDGNEKIKEIIIDRLYSVFEINKKLANKNKYLEDIELYIVNKVYNIIETYDFYISKYKQAFDNFTNHIIATTTDILVSEFEPIFSETINKFFVDIKEDPSHISVKFKQAVNFIKYNNLQYFINNNVEKTHINEKIELDTYNNLIIDIQNNSQNESISIIELLPPAIFKIEFYLDDPDESNFSQASSGEYQLMSVLSSILYHIRNIDSVDNQYSYRYIAIILDEVELYFHPNMQRNFIRKLILALSKLECNIWSMHILFATHSPFILSDIVQQKILKISNGEVHKIDNNYNSFAANIHDLLADEFFLEAGNMGAFATQQIEIAINLLNYIRTEKELKSIDSNQKDFPLLDKYKNNLFQLGYWNSEKFKDRNRETEKTMLNNLIEIIGEPVIQHKLKQMYQGVYDVSFEKNKSDAVAEIKQLIEKYNIDPNKII